MNYPVVDISSQLFRGALESVLVPKLEKVKCSYLQVRSKKSLKST